MEWEKASGCDRDVGAGNSIRKEEVVVGVGGGGEERRRDVEAGGMGAEGVLYVKVMTDEQIEVLRRQIAVYAIICEQLVEMHKAVTAQQDSLAGMRLGGLYADSLMVPGGHKITARQRWTPTSMQLQILESMFEQGHGTPSKQKIKEITLELSQHGHISETNVYNWFQNRRARSKRKQTATPLQSNAEYEVEADDESPPNDQKRQLNQRSHDENVLPLGSLHVAQMNNDMHNQTQRVHQLNEGSRSSGDSGRISYFENILSNQRLDQLMGSMDIPGSFSSFNSGESFDMMG